MEVVYCIVWLANVRTFCRWLATGRTVRVSNPGGGKISRPRGPPRLLYNGDPGCLPG